jgi:hypothetical protein
MLILLELLWQELVTIVKEKKELVVMLVEQETEINNEIAELLIS